MTERRIESLGALDRGLDGSAVFVFVFVFVAGESRPGAVGIEHVLLQAPSAGSLLGDPKTDL